MIECSICHVMNEDSARFCAECGQRLVSADHPAEPETSNFQAEPVVPALDQAQQVMPAPLSTPVNPMPTAASPSSAPLPTAQPAAPLPTMASSPVPTTPQPRLRSPLLSGDDEPDLEAERQTRLRPGRQPSNSPKGLRSPLLGGNEDDDDYSDSFDNPPAKSGGLRSPLLGNSDFDNYENEPTTGSHLHSPLLDGDNVQNKSSYNTGSRPGHLRSPLLGQDYDEEEDFIDEQVTQDNANVLRSPLLQSRVPMGGQKSTQPGPTGSPAEAEPKISADKAAILQKLEQSKYGGPATPAADPPGATSGSSKADIGLSSPAEQAAGGQSAFRSPDPFAGATPAPSTNWPSITQSPMPEVIGPPDRSGSNPWTNPRSGEAKSPEKTVDSYPLTGQQATSDASTAAGASWVDIKAGASPSMPGSTLASTSGSPAGPTSGSAPGSISGSTAGSPSGSIFASAPAATPANQPGSSDQVSVPTPPVNKPRLQSRLLAHDNNNDDVDSQPANTTPSLRRFGESPSFPGPGPEHAGVIQFFVICLYIGIAMKIWVMFEFFQGGSLSLPVIGDELGQIVAMLFLVFLGSIYTKPSS